MILVIGDAMQDEYWHGTSSRLSPEAAVPIVTIERIETRAGGAANVANNIEAMGVPVIRMFGNGQLIRKVRLLAERQHIARIDYDYPQKTILPHAAFLAAVARCSLVVAVDYGKGSLSGIQALIQAANGIPVLIDPKGSDWERYRGAALVKPNRDEFRALGEDWTAYGIGALLLTEAADGMTLYTRTGSHHQASENPNPVDVSGAGEAVLAAFAVAWAKGYPIIDAMPYAARAAGLAISRFGTVVLAEEEVFGTR